MQVRSCHCHSYNTCINDEKITKISSEHKRVDKFLIQFKIRLNRYSTKINLEFCCRVSPNVSGLVLQMLIL